VNRIKKAIKALNHDKLDRAFELLVEEMMERDAGIDFTMRKLTEEEMNEIGGHVKPSDLEGC